MADHDLSKYRIMASYVLTSAGIDLRLTLQGVGSVFN